MLTDSVSREALQEVAASVLSAAFARWSVLPPEKWAEGVRRMPAAFGGTRPFSFRYAPYQLQMFLSLFDPKAQEVVLQLFSRGGKSEVVLNALGYEIAEQPRHIFVMWPTLGQGKKWSKDNLQRELIDPTPALSARIGDGTGRRKSDNTILHKIFDGGLLDIVGANSPGDIRRAKGNRLYADEIDAIVEIQSDEGDQLKQFKGRGDEFPDTREVYCSYPSLKGRSRIEGKLLESDLRQWFVTCPVCGGEPFILHRTGVGTFGDSFKRSKLLFEPDRPQDARLECPVCKAQLTDTQRYAAMMGGDPAKPRFDLWRPTREFRGKIGYHANALLWPHPVEFQKYPGGWLQHLAQDQIDIEKSDNPERTRRVFVNRVDAETFESECNQKPEHTTLFLRREDYVPTKMLPAGVLWIAFACDVQADRIEVEFIGFGQNAQTWGLGYHVLKGTPLVPATEGVWAELDSMVLGSTFPHPSGKILRAAGGLVDCGYKPDSVFAYTRPRAPKGIFASRGSTSLCKPIVSNRPGREGKPKTKVWTLGTHEAKDQIYQCLERDNRSARGYLHFTSAAGFGYSEKYFAMLVAEDSSDERAGDGKFYRFFECPDGVRNESLDLRVMGLAIERIRQPNYKKLAEELALKDSAATVGAPPPPAPAAPSRPLKAPGFVSGGRPRRPGGGFVRGW